MTAFLGSAWAPPVLLLLLAILLSLSGLSIKRFEERRASEIKEALTTVSKSILCSNSEYQGLLLISIRTHFLISRIRELEQTKLGEEKQADRYQETICQENGIRRAQDCLEMWNHIRSEIDRKIRDHCPDFDTGAIDILPSDIEELPREIVIDGPARAALCEFRARRKKWEGRYRAGMQQLERQFSEFTNHLQERVRNG